MNLFLVCYEPTAGSVTPSEFTNLLDSLGAQVQVLATAWLVEGGSSGTTPEILRDDILHKLEQSGDELSHRRFLLVARLDGHPSFMRTHVETGPLWNFLHSR